MYANINIIKSKEYNKIFRIKYLSKLYDNSTNFIIVQKIWIS